jgi:sporulation protein YunB
MVTDIKIPIGNAVGGVIFTGRGPSFTVKILSVASVQTRFTNSFENAGINQTRHKIMLEVSAVINLYVPGTRETTTTVTTLVEVAETVIVGQVPNVYADMGDGN